MNTLKNFTAALFSAFAVIVLVFAGCSNRPTEPSPDPDMPCATSAGAGGAKGEGGYGGQSAASGGGQSGETCAAFPAYAASGQACAASSDCPPTGNPCMPATCTAGGVCVASDPGEGQPGQCSMGQLCMYVAQGELGCCSGRLQCIYDPAAQCSGDASCPASNPVCVDGLCCKPTR